MFRFMSLSSFEIKERGRVFVVESPFSCNRNDVLNFLGGKVEIDGVEYNPIGVEVFSLATPLHIGETIGILVAPNKACSVQRAADCGYAAVGQKYT